MIRFYTFTPSFTRLVLFALMLPLLAGCFNNRGGKIAYDPEDFGRPDVRSLSQADAMYTLQPLDKVEVRVLNEPSLSGSFQLNERAELPAPLLGLVEAFGLTPFELSERLETQYEAEYLRDAQVFVTATPSERNSVTVEGSVKDPGLFNSRTDMTLLRAVALAGGTSAGANPRRTVIFRTIDGERNAAAFDLTDIRRGEMADPQVFAGDIVVVDGSQTRETWRDILSTLPVIAVFSRF